MDHSAAPSVFNLPAPTVPEPTPSSAFIRRRRPPQNAHSDEEVIAALRDMAVKRLHDGDQEDYAIIENYLQARPKLLRHTGAFARVTKDGVEVTDDADLSLSVTSRAIYFKIGRELEATGSCF
jgi:hypothetical protein